MRGVDTGSTVLAVDGVRCSLGGRVLLDGIAFSLAVGESVAVTGPSGSGKSTLLSCILGLRRPDAGTVLVAGTDITGLSKRRLAAFRRRHMGMVFQFGELLPELSPVENVALAALLGGMPADAAYGAAAKLLTQLGVPTGETTTGLLSGGERQRASVARALVCGPSLVLADEPTGALDAATREAVADLLFEVPRSHGCGLVVVTHDPAIAARADRCYRLESGDLAEVAA